MFANYAEAIRDYNRATELNPKNADYYKGRGLCKVKLRDKAGAIEDFSKVVELTGDADAYYCRGNAKHELQDYLSAILDYNIAIERSNPLELERGRIFIWFQRNLPYSKFIEHSFKISEYYARRAQAKTELQDYTGAVLDYSKTIKLTYKYFPHYDYAYSDRAKTKVELHDYEGAIEDYNVLISRNFRTFDSDYYYARGQAKEGLKDIRGALADYSKAGELGKKKAYEDIQRIQKGQ
jgi:tetratricopeptide (TPR) repeat protein